MASLMISKLLLRSFSSASTASLYSRGGSGYLGRQLSNYSTAAELEDPIEPTVKVQHTQLLIDGNFANAASGKTFPTLDPRTGEVIARVAEGDSQDIVKAVAAARTAFDHGPWPRMPAYERQRILSRAADLIERHGSELAALETWDSGKPLEQAAQFDIPLVIRHFRYFAGWADKIYGLTVPAPGSYQVHTLDEPIGVVGQIIPCNFPLLTFAWNVAPALACGNTIVLKTAEQTPLSALYASLLLHEAGLPSGVLNVVSGFGPTAGAALASHMDVDKLAFSGSTNTGRLILEMSARSNLKRVTMELGGRSPIIICEDADVDEAVELAHFATFFNQGQCSWAGSRTFVHERVYDEFVRKASARALKRAVGDPFKPGTEQGPQIDSARFEEILKCVRSGVESGASLETGGDRYGTKGFYIKPTVLSNVQDDMPIAHEEMFGPVQSILKFKDLDEVIRRANRTRYGLAAGVFTKNADTAYTLSRALRAGTVWWNCYHVLDSAIPFGGYKMNGMGRDLQVKALVAPLKNFAWL